MRDLVPLVFGKAIALRDKWNNVIREANVGPGKGHVLNVCNWAGRVTFDVMGSAGFDYELNAIENGDNELLKAYTDMFEVAISRNRNDIWHTLPLFFPILRYLIVSGWVVDS